MQLPRNEFALQISRSIVTGPKEIIRFWWGSGLSHQGSCF